ncbi:MULTISPECIES: nitroreductase family protein [unclassified Streptomyces]|uniref:nitroreductase family protein n=1 Tax=Streptomycetaceae TaxID=2062 RepID=UPI002E7A926A|nr:MULTISPECIES: nitroreductase family protein [unclassified Streptomyces]MED7953272.1 nitroreductase family protein [Streptomyces sp. BE303]MEE1828621.1 nitroreductase family protein [Streptomyces sp. BE20]
MPYPDLTAEQLLTTTRAVRKRLDLTRPVARELVEECLALATQAPTGRNRQRWDFVIVTDPARRAALADLYRLGLVNPRRPVVRTGLDRTTEDTARRLRLAESAQHLFDRLHEVPVLVVPCVRIEGRHEFDSHVGQANAWGSILPATWQFMLAARSRGLGTAWTTPHLHYEREAADLLGIPYETVAQVALVPLAHTVGTDFRPGPRVPTDRITHWDAW